MGHFLNFGAGPNQLPPPWQNLNALHDIRKPLKFEDGSASRILAEHVIEHVPFLQGYGFLLECMRILEPGGVLRLAFPDPVRLLAVGVDGFSLGPMAEEYAAALGERQASRGVLPAHRAGARGGVSMILTGWHHQCIWSQHTAAVALLSAGFVKVQNREYGRGELAGVDGHHIDVGPRLATLESTILEATK